MFRDKEGMSMRDLIESQGEAGAVEVVRNCLETKKLRPEDFSIKEIWESLHGAIRTKRDIAESIVASAFPKITGEIINAKVINAYNSAAQIGDMLVTTVQSNLETETFAGFTEAETPEEVGEGMLYNDSTITEKYVTVRASKFGRKISITEEAIYFDRTGQILMRAQRVGAKAAQYKERMIMRGVQDLDTKVYNPSGVATAFYSTTNNNLVATNPFTDDGLDAVRLKASQMKDDSLGTIDDDFILIDLNNAIVLVPQQLERVAWEYANTAKAPATAENADNFYKGLFRVLSSPYVTQNSATTWYWGDFKQDFIWQEVWPLQTIAAPSNHPDSFDRDIKAQIKTRFYGNVGAIDFKHCLKSTA
jgi:hypothetical protein